MGKVPREDPMIVDQLDSLHRQQEHLRKQIDTIIRLIQGDTTLNTIRPTGLLNDFKDMDERIKGMQKNTSELVEWWNDRSKRKYIINVDLVAWGKVIAWTIATIAGIIGLVRWVNSIGPK